MNWHCAFLAVSFCIAHIACGADATNFVLFLADDLGYADVGCYGYRPVETPNIDRLAERGVRFTAHYANGPECTPTRTALLTGRYQHRFGGLECAIGTGNVGRYDEAIALASRHELGLPASEQTIVKMLKCAGYRTALFGKWHLGYKPQFSPHRHGFDEALYCIGGGMEYFHHVENLPGYPIALYQHDRPVQRKGYFTDIITSEAKRFVAENKDRPFFLYVAYTAPHFPYQGPEDYRPTPLPLDSPVWSPRHAPLDTYDAMIRRMDESIGEVIQELKNDRLLDNTLIIFASDNGGAVEGSNGPLRGFKGSTFEGSIRVPLILSWNNRIPAGTICEIPTGTFDITVTLADVAGVQPTPDKPFDGMSLLEVLGSASASSLHRTLYWRKPRGDTVWMAVRDGNWKYVAEQKGTQKTEYLFNLAQDVGETRDLSAERPEVLDALRSRYKRWEITVRANRRR